MKLINHAQARALIQAAADDLLNLSQQQSLQASKSSSGSSEAGMPLVSCM